MKWTELLTGAVEENYKVTDALMAMVTDADLAWKPTEGTNWMTTGQLLFHLTGSKAEDIDVVMIVDEVGVEKQQQALDCYVTYRETMEKAGARRNIPREAVFEVYQEVHDPPLESLFDGLTENQGRKKSDISLEP